jgi:hypothetical protein
VEIRGWTVKIVSDHERLALRSLFKRCSKDILLFRGSSGWAPLTFTCQLMMRSIVWFDYKS